jgi:hypothetical protein
MSAAPKTPADKKARRQKQFIAVGSVVLLALLGFELPKLLGGSKEAAPAVTTVLPSPVGSGSSPAAAAGKLPDTDRVVIQRDSDQLLSFGLFKSKHPFVQQLSAAPAAPATTPAPTPPPPSKTTTRASTVPAPTVPSPSTVPVTPVTTTPIGTTTTTSTTPTAPPTAPTGVFISTNGICQTVALNGTFPANEDIFRIVSIARDGKSVEIGVVGGAYDSGQAAATLKLGETLTLVNTADGTRYVIALKSKCDVATQPSPETSTTPVATTPVPPAPTTTTTTATVPVVTDSLDTTVPSS